MQRISTNLLDERAVRLFPFFSLSSRQKTISKLFQNDCPSLCLSDKFAFSIRISCKVIEILKLEALISPLGQLQIRNFKILSFKF